ncbi:hypothetical protein [Actinoplanes awajinensis]|uniref:Uncharacterized protein n=1 Tax=Actinoplanes awajinensis subsp. mycoplanecinus TaxID=135947 RepID=A0A101JEY4_9ACTN|nr:hypothetical protein [Actinoplanes awajinensis]KUL25500.1 hypothetical protein ADL15_40560 [Actinoplanes awajinensis subsp. mycoplanecinus]
MPYVLGIDIGAGSTKAAVCRRADGPGRGWGPPQPVPLGVRSRTVSSALVMTPDGDVVPAGLGREPVAGAVGGYLHAVGDSTPMPFGDDYYPAHGMVAAMARWVVDRVWQQLDEPPERIACAYPSGWGAGRLHLLHSALGEADLAHTALVTRARAVVESHQAAGRVPAVGGPLLAYRIGGSTCELAVAAPHGPGRLELLGSTEFAEPGGFDLDGLNPAAARALLLPTVDLAMHTVRACGVAPGDLSAVLIAGGSGPVYTLVSDLLTAAFPVPVLRDQDALMTVAAGAALAVRPQVRRPAPPSRPAPPDEPELAAVASIPTDAWPQVTRSGPATAERPPRPPVTVAAIRPADR